MSGSVIRRSRALVLIATAAVGASLLTAGGAQAAPVKCTITSFSPTKFIVGASRVEKTFSVKTSSGCKADTWKIKMGPDLTLDAINYNGLYMEPSQSSNSDAGMSMVDVSAASKTSGAARGTKTLPFYVQRRSTFSTSFNASPEPAAKGASISITGTLKRVSWGTTPSYVTYAGRSVQLQFKAKGTTTYVNYKAVTTDAAGKVTTKVKAKKSGTWRLHYYGNSTTGAASSTADAVVVS